MSIRPEAAAGAVPARPAPLAHQTSFDTAVQVAARRQSRRLVEFRLAVADAERDAYIQLCCDDVLASHRTSRCGSA